MNNSDQQQPNATTQGGNDSQSGSSKAGPRCLILALLLTVVPLLLVAMAAISMIGALVGQRLPLEAYTERYGDAFGIFLFRSGLANVFRTWSFQKWSQSQQCK